MDSLSDQPSTLGSCAAVIAAHARQLADQLQGQRLELFPPQAEKPLRAFPAAEAAKFLGVKSAYLNSLAVEGKGPQPRATASGRRTYTAQQIQELRAWLGATGRRNYDPRRRGSEHLQAIAVINFKGGSAKTTTAAHAAQHLALRGHRVLAIDLDPQASLSALHGYQPEFDVGANESLYGAIRYDDAARPLRQVIRRTNFPGLDIIPGGAELMEFEHETALVLAAGDGGQKQAFFFCLAKALSEVRDDYDVVVIDCPPHLGFLTMACLCTATAVLITVHPQMLDVMSMSQFLLMLGSVLGELEKAGVEIQHDWFRYLVTRFEPGDGPQAQMVEFLRTLFGSYVIPHNMLKSVAISDAGITKQTLYEVERSQFTRTTYDRAMECLDLVNGEIERLVHEAWSRGDTAAKAIGAYPENPLEPPEEIADVA